LSPVGAYVGRLLGNAIPSPLQVNHDQYATPDHFDQRSQEVVDGYWKALSNNRNY
jgi:hypothetical protein